MSVYRKDDNGNIKKIAGSLTQRINMHIFQTTHVFDTEKNEDNYIINESDAKPYISSIKDWTQYSINLSEPNQSSNINIKLGSQTLKLINNVKNIEIGTLKGVIQCHTEKLDNNEIFLDVVGTVVSLNGVEKTSMNTDTTPTANSQNLVTSGGVHDYPAIVFAESERQKSKNLFDYAKFQQVGRANYYLKVNVGSSIGVYAPVGNSNGIYCWIEQYDENKTLLKGSNYWEDKFILQLEPTTKYLRFDTVSDYSQFMICYANSVDEIGNYQSYNGQITHNGDTAVEFAEKEYQKSKNLIPYPYHDGNSIVSNGITFTANNDQSISVSGSIVDHNSNAVMWLAWDMPLKAGNYRISDSNSSNDLSVVAWIGNDYYQKDVNNGMFTLSSDTTARIYLQVAKGSTKTYNDTIRFMLCEGTDTDWQPYNGAIVHEKEFHESLQNTPAIAFAESERQKSKNLCGLIDFEQTINGVTIKLISSSQTVILNGTATSTFDAMTTVRNMLPYVSNMQGEDLKVTAYYLSGTKSDTAIAFISTVDNDDVFGDRSAGIALPDNNSTSINFSPSKNSTYNTLVLYTVNGASFTNYMFRIQIEKGQVTNWEYPHGPISHNKELDDVAVSNSTFSLSEANANSYQSVYDLLRVNRGVGNFYFAGNDYPSFLPPCPEDVWHGTGNIDQIVVKIDTSNFTKSLSMTLQGINQNTPAYKLDAYFDGTNWRNSGWYKPIAVELIYDKDTKNTIGGPAYTNGIKFNANIIINVAGYSKTKIYSRVYNTYNITEVVIDKTGWTGNSFMIFDGASAIKNVGILIYHEGTTITPAECFNFSDSTGLNNNDNAYVYRIEGIR